MIRRHLPLAATLSAMIGLLAPAAHAEDVAAIEARVANAGLRAEHDDLLALAQAYAAAHQPARAAVALDRAINAGATAAEHRQRLAQLWEGAARFEEAVLANKAAADAAPQAAWAASAHLRAAELLHERLGDIRRAAAEYASVARTFPGTPEARRALLDGLLATGSDRAFDGVRTSLQVLAATQFPDDARLILLAAPGFARYPDPAQGLATLRAAIQATPALGLADAVVDAEAAAMVATNQRLAAAQRLLAHGTAHDRPDFLRRANELVSERADKATTSLAAATAMPWEPWAVDLLQRARDLGADQAAVRAAAVAIAPFTKGQPDRRARVLAIQAGATADARVRATLLTEAIAEQAGQVSLDQLMADADQEPLASALREGTALRLQLAHLVARARSGGDVAAHQAAIATAIAEAGITNEGEARWGIDRIRELSDKAGVEATAAAMRRLVDAPLSKSARDHLAKAIRSAIKDGAVAKELGDRAQAPSTGPLAGALTDDPDTLLALARRPPAEVTPAVRSWLWSAAINAAARARRPTSPIALEAAAITGSAHARWALELAVLRNEGDSQAAALAAAEPHFQGEATGVWPNQIRAYASMLLRTERTAEVNPTLERLLGADRRSWSRDHWFEAAAAAVASEDRATWLATMSAAAIRDDQGAIHHLRNHAKPPAAWVAAAHEQRAASERDPQMRAVHAFLANPTDPTLAQTVLRDAALIAPATRERALHLLITHAHEAKDRSTEVRLLRDLVGHAQEWRLTDGASFAATVRRILEPRLAELTDAQVLPWLEAGVRFGGHGEHTIWLARQLTDRLRAGDPVASAIAMQRLVRCGWRDDRNHFDRVMDEIATEQTAGRLGIAAPAWQHAAEWFGSGRVDADRITRARRLAAEAFAQLGTSAAGAAAIDDRSPQAPLLRAAALLATGDEGEAWRQAQDHLALLNEHLDTAPAPLILLVARNLARAGEHQDARELLHGVLQARGDGDHDLAAGARLQLGDIMFREENHRAAALEFQAVMATWPNTPAARDAALRVGDCFLAQRRFDEARRAYERHLDDPDPDTRVRALFRLGLLENQTGDAEAALERFRAVAALQPPKHLADELYLDWGRVLIDRSQLAEAENVLTLVGLSGGRDPVTPGEPLRITLRDTFLQASQHRTSVPVVVTTAKGDREEVELILSADIRGLFSGSIPTALGDAQPGDRVLQLRGDDTIRYDYTDEFKHGRRTLAVGSGEITVAADAELKAGPTSDSVRFADAAAADQDGLARLGFTAVDREHVDEAAELARSRSRKFRGGAELKPGNPIHIAVRDADRSLTGNRDRVVAVATTTSGDQAQVDLMETDPDAGAFVGVLPTTLRPPGIAVSDSAPGHSALDLLVHTDAPDFDRAERAWIAAGDRKAGKLVTVDLRAAQVIDALTWSRGRTSDGAPADRRPTQWRVELSHDGAQWTTLHSSENPRALAGRLLVRTQKPARGTIITTTAARRALGALNPVAVVPDRDSQRAGWTALRSASWESDPRGEDPVHTEAVGQLLIPSAGRYEFAVQGVGRAWLQFGDQLVVEKTVDDDQRTATGEPQWRGLVDLPFGHVPVRLLLSDDAGRTGFRLLWRRGEETAFSEVPAAAVRHDAPAEDLATFIGGPITATALADRHGFRVAFPPVEARLLRLVVDAWSDGDAPAVASVVVSHADQVLVPQPGTDYHAAADDGILALSPGEEVTITYRDERTRTNRSEILRQRLRATYFDGQIGVFEARTSGGADDLREDLFERFRFAVGERLTVRVTDYDADISDQPDTLPVRFVSPRGEVTVDAIETGLATGVFQAEIRTTTAAERERFANEAVLLVEAGDTVAVSYVDEDNTAPGRAVRRSASVREANQTVGRIALRPSAWSSDAALATPRIVYGASALTAEIVLAPLSIVVTDPDSYVSTGSRVRVRLTTSVGATTDVVLSGDGGLAESGVFSGTVAVVLGDAGDPVWRLAIPGQPRTTAVSADPEAPLRAEPVLPIAGGVTITATYLEDLPRLATPEEADVQAARPDLPQAQANLITPGRLLLTDDRYEDAVPFVHLGGKLCIKLDDPDASLSATRDRVPVTVTAASGATVTVELEETETRSGVFTGSLTIEAVDAITPPTPAEPTVAAAIPPGVLPAQLGDMVTVTYAEPDREPTVLTVPVAKGFDGSLAAFAKRFATDRLAVQTMIRLAEAHFELYKRHRAAVREIERRPTGREGELDVLHGLIADELAEGTALLRQVATEAGDATDIDRVLYLLGQFEQESGRPAEAIDRYRNLLAAFPASAHAPEAQYKIAQCYEDLKRFDDAWDAYVRLAYRWPTHELVADAMVRIGLYYQDRGKAALDLAEAAWKRGELLGAEPPLPPAAVRDFRQAAAVFAKMVERFGEHPIADQIQLAHGNALLLARDWLAAKAVFEGFVLTYPRSIHLPKALYWGANAALSAGQTRDAYLRLARLIQDHPESTEARLARGLLMQDERLKNLNLLDERK